jgi:hypothetical protein
MMKLTHRISLLGLFFASLLLFVACDRDEDLPSIEDDIPEDALFYFSGRVDGEDILLILSPTNPLQLFDTNGGSVGLEECLFDYGSLLLSVDEEPPSFGIELQNFFDGFCREERDLFNTLFPPAEIDFAQDDEFTTDRVVNVEIGTAAGFFKTELGDQPDNAKFEITKSEANNNALGLFQDIEGRLSNCRLYHVDDPSKVIELEEGIFKLSLSPFYQ